MKDDSVNRVPMASIDYASFVQISQLHDLEVITRECVVRFLLEQHIREELQRAGSPTFSLT